MAGTSPKGSPEAIANTDVLALQMDVTAYSEQSAMMVRLTDECISAIQRAQEANLRVKMRIDAKGGMIEIGTGDQVNTFRFVVQQLPGAPSDAVVFDPSNGYRSTAALQSKIQVQATDKSFAETREKAQKLAEEKRKVAKDVSRGRKDQKSVVVKRAVNPIAVGAQRPVASSSGCLKPHLDSSKSNSSKSSKFVQNRTNVNGTVSPRAFFRAELLRKPLRKRLVHLVVLGQFKNTREVIERFRKDGVNDEMTQDLSKAVDIVDEISETNKETGRLQLRQSFYNEVDTRWTWFSSEEKATVRRIIASCTINASNFAPTRKSGMAPPHAPLSGTHASNISLETVPSVSARSQHRLTAPSLSCRKTSPKAPPLSGSKCKNSTAPAFSNSSNSVPNCLLDDLLPSSTPCTLKRKARVPAIAVQEKRPRQQSLSPPDDPTSANSVSAPSNQANTKKCEILSTSDKEKIINEKPNAALKGEKISVPNETAIHQPKERSENIVSFEGSVDSIATEPQPSFAWRKLLPDIQDMSDAERYYDMFLAEYPDYLHCYNLLSRVSNEFGQMEKQLKEFPLASRQHAEVEKTIQGKYAQYQCNNDYLHSRQRHADLREKLLTLKVRLASWELRNNKADHTDRAVNTLQTTDNEHAANRVFVMSSNQEESDEIQIIAQIQPAIKPIIRDTKRTQWEQISEADSEVEFIKQTGPNVTENNFEEEERIKTPCFVEEDRDIQIIGEISSVNRGIINMTPTLIEEDEDIQIIREIQGMSKVTNGKGGDVRVVVEECGKMF